MHKNYWIIHKIRYSMKEGFASIILLSTLLVMCIVVFCGEGDWVSGDYYIIIEPGRSTIESSKHGTIINGWDSYSTTYFFLPSYMNIERLNYSKSRYKMYDSNGKLLEKPDINTTLDVQVDTEDGRIPYKVAFCKSENISSIELNLNYPIGEIKHGVYSPAEMRVISSDDREEFFSQSVMIKGRGNTTWIGGEKKPYEVKLPEATSLCGMGAVNKWVFLANLRDETRILNKLAFDVARDIGMEYSIESEWVDLFINGDYLGNYLLCHEPDIGKSDLNIQNLQGLNKPFFVGETPFETIDTKGFDYRENITDISGGYLIEEMIFYANKRCGFKLDDGYHTFNIKSPNNASKRQVDYIADFTRKIDAELNNLSENAVPEHIDPDSFAKRYLVDELLYNTDTARASHFFYKKPGVDIMYAGPCWDYDQAGGQSSDGLYAPNYRDFRGSVLDLAELEDYRLYWNNLLIRNQFFHDYVKKTFSESMATFDNVINERIDEYYTQIRASRNMDRIRWKYACGGVYTEDYSDFRWLKFFMYNRLKYYAELYGLDFELDEPEINDGTTHVVTFVFKDGHEEYMIVGDGAILDADDLPKYDADDAEDGWVVQGAWMSQFLPIFEDMKVELW